MTQCDITGQLALAQITFNSVIENDMADKHN